MGKIRWLFFCPSLDHPTIEDQIPVLQHDKRKARCATSFAAEQASLKMYRLLRKSLFSSLPCSFLGGHGYSYPGGKMEYFVQEFPESQGSFRFQPLAFGSVFVAPDFENALSFSFMGMNFTWHQTAMVWHL